MSLGLAILLLHVLFAFIFILICFWEEREYYRLRNIALSREINNLLSKIRDWSIEP